MNIYDVYLIIYIFGLVISWVVVGYINIDKQCRDDVFVCVTFSFVWPVLLPVIIIIGIAGLFVDFGEWLHKCLHK